MTSPTDAIAFRTGCRSQSQFLSHYGEAWAFGWAWAGQLGLSNLVDRLAPVKLPGVGWKSFTGTLNGSGAVLTTGTLWTCGAGTTNGPSPLGFVSSGDISVFAQVGSATDWASVAFGENTGYGVKTTGALYAWGVNSFGQYGDGTTSTSTTPVLVLGIGSGVVDAAAGSSFVIIRKADGTIWSAGANTQGQLGLNHTTSPITTLTQIGAATTWAQISCGQEHSAAIDTSGRLWTWGRGSNALGQGDLTIRLVPTQVGTDTDWAEVRCGAYFTAARKTSGTLWSWGSNGSGQLGHGDTVARSTPTQVGVATEWVGIGASEVQLHAKTATDVYSTGGNLYGTLGLNDITQRTTLTPIVFDFIAAGLPITISELATAADASFSYEIGSNLIDAANGSEDINSSIITLYLEAAHLTDNLLSSSITTGAIMDLANLSDVIRQALDQLVTDTANGFDSFSLGAAITLVEIAQAAETQSSTYNSVMLVAELIATLEAYNGADSADITEAGVLTDAFAARVQAIAAVLEAAQAVDTNTVLVHVMQSASDTADAVTDITSSGSILNALLSEGALATIRLNIGGELFTGWVLNTDTLAPSEYQFADRQFNSACKHGDRYLMAAEDGVYEFTEDAGVETVMTYIKTGKTDFGSDLRKYIPNSYMVYSASGDMALKVTTSEFGKLQTRNYRMVPPAGGDTTATRRFDIGKGIRSRYWQFELVGDGVDCDIDEIGMLPVVLSRRI